MKSYCGNCNWRGVPKIDLLNIEDLAKRLDEGSVVPSGECPKCRALCYPVKPKPKVVAHAVPVVKSDAKSSVKFVDGYEVRIKKGRTWYTVCECYYNPFIGNGMQTATKIARLLNGE